jgi:phosphoglycerate kinase
VPTTDDGAISDDTRLRSAVPTIHALQAAGASIILMSHFGRPKGQVNATMSLKFLIAPLEKLIGSPIAFANDCVGEDAKTAAKALKSGEILLLENTRFHSGESDDCPDFSAQLASLGDIFIHDAFSASHRAHGSSHGIAAHLPAYAGLAMARELDHLSQALEHPKSPVLAVVGGAKVSTKIDLLKNLVARLDMLAIGGGMANTFLAALGHDVGKSLCEHDLKGTALEIMANAKRVNCQILLPLDGIAATDFAAHAPHRVCGLDDVKPDEMILDAGPATVEQLADAIDAAKTLIWNGPLGAFEIAPFDTATVEAAQYAAKRVKAGKLIAVAGGGDTVAALHHARAADDFTFVSTAGGAFLEWMEGKALPGIEILKK